MRLSDMMFLMMCHVVIQANSSGYKACGAPSLHNKGLCAIDSVRAGERAAWCLPATIADHRPHTGHSGWDGRGEGRGRLWDGGGGSSRREGGIPPPENLFKKFISAGICLIALLTIINH